MSRSSSLIVVVAVATAAFASTGCKKPASIAFAQKVPITIEDSVKPLPAPAVVALDKNGNPMLEQTPPVKFTVEPPTILSVDNDKLIPLKNGDAKLIATAEGLPKAELAVHVAVIDEVHLNCAQPCALHVGENMVIEATATGLGERITTGIELTSSDPVRATVDATGKVSGTGAGTVVITAKLGKKSTEVKLEVHPSVDELRLMCPWPPLIVSVKKGEGAVATERSCEVLEGEDVVLTAVTASKGEVISGERIEWRSSDPSVRVVAGTITGDHAGGSMIEIHVGDLSAELPVSVISAGARGLGNGHCSTSDGSLTNRFEVKLALKNSAGAAQDEDRTYRCETTVAKKCLDDAVGEITRAVAKTTLEMKSALQFGESSLDERARRCCCKH